MIANLKAWLAGKGWSINAGCDWGRRNRFINWLRANTYATADYAGVHVALLGFNLSVTKYKRGRG